MKTVTVIADGHWQVGRVRQAVMKEAHRIGLPPDSIGSITAEPVPGRKLRVQVPIDEKGNAGAALRVKMAIVGRLNATR